MPQPALGRPGMDVGMLHPSAEDFDATGILRGIDPCESRYWWMPELSSSTSVPAESVQAERLPQPS